MRISIHHCAVPLALALCQTAQAQTIFVAGNYVPGEAVAGNGSLTLGPGSYRFSFETTVPFADFYGQVQKESFYEEFCDEGDGEFACGGNNVPTIPLFEPVSPLLYQLDMTVDPSVETLHPGQFVVRTIEFDECCTYAFDFIAGDTAGNYRIFYETLGSAAVPEPASWALLVLGFGVLGAAARRRKSALRFAPA